jgi:hypothetical protein
MAGYEKGCEGRIVRKVSVLPVPVGILQEKRL